MVQRLNTYSSVERDQMLRVPALDAKALVGFSSMWDPLMIVSGTIKQSKTVST